MQTEEAEEPFRWDTVLKIVHSSSDYQSLEHLGFTSNYKIH